VFKRRTSSFRKRKQVKALQARVVSPRIVWFDFQRWLGSMVRFLLWIAVVFGLGFGLWRGIEAGLLKNDDFQLRQIVLNENPAVDEVRLLEVTRIDLKGTIFDCDPDRIEAQLTALPEVARASVLRNYPGDLHVTVAARRPFVWVACKEAGILPRDRRKGRVVDSQGYLFPVTPQGFEAALPLPVIHLRGGRDLLASGKVTEHPDYRRALRLLQVAEKRLPEAREWIESIRMHKSWGSRLRTRDDIEATFGHTDLERQMDDFLSAVEHARQRGDRIATISLVGRRNLPVTFHEVAAPRAIVVPEPEGDPDLQQLLER
jgi:cell division septal protein FtsQ